MSHFCTLHFELLLHPPRPTLFPYTTLFRSTPSSRPFSKICSSIGTLVAIHPAPVICPAATVPGACRPATVEGVVGVIDTKDRKSTRLNSSHRCISYAVFCLKKQI